MTKEQERQIIQRVIEGDKEAFEELVLANQNNVYNLALKMMRNADDALDISQEAFIKAYRSLAAFRGESRFTAWLYKLTYNLCIDAIRKRPEEKALSLESSDTDDEHTAIEVPDIRYLPEESVIRKETRRIIADGINNLPQKYRDILIMREVTGMSYDEIAGTSGIDIGTVKSRLSRARLRLVKILEKSGTIPDSYRLKIQEEPGGGETV